MYIYLYLGLWYRLIFVVTTKSKVNSQDEYFFSLIAYFCVDIYWWLLFSFRSKPRLEQRFPRLVNKITRVAPDTELAGYPVSGRISGWIVKGRHKKTTGWHFFNNYYSFRNFIVIFSGDLGFEERIYHVKFFWPDIRPTGKRNRISGRIPDIKKAGYPAGRISDATLVIAQTRTQGFVLQAKIILTHSFLFLYFVSDVLCKPLRPRSNPDPG